MPDRSEIKIKSTDSETGAVVVEQIATKEFSQAELVRTRDALVLQISALQSRVDEINKLII